MIFIAYAFLIIGLVAYSRGTIALIPPRLELLARALGAVAGVSFAGIALLLLSGAASMLGTLMLLLLAVGAGVYVWGLVRWRSPDGFALRRAGWFAIIAALAVPSTLTLLMPVACLLVLTLRSTSERPTPFARLSPPVRR